MHFNVESKSACKNSIGRKNLDPQLQKQLDTRLCFAAFNAEFEKIKVLLEKGADPNNTRCLESTGDNASAVTPLYMALLGYRVKDEDVRALEILSPSQANDKQRVAVRALISAGADPNQKLLRKVTPLMYAKFLKDDALEKALIESGAVSDPQDGQGDGGQDNKPNEGKIKLMANHIVMRFAAANANEKATKDDAEASEKDLINAIAPKR